MVELVFVIVIIGILAAIAIPKLLATRDDARVSNVLNSLATCITDGGSSYTSRLRVSLSSKSCQDALKCFDITLGNDDESNGSIIVTSGSGVNEAPDRNLKYCRKAYGAAESHGLSSPSGKEHRFGGTRVSF